MLNCAMKHKDMHILCITPRHKDGTCLWRKSLWKPKTNIEYQYRSWWCPTSVPQWLKEDLFLHAIELISTILLVSHIFWYSIFLIFSHNEDPSSDLIKAFAFRMEDQVLRFLDFSFQDNPLDIRGNFTHHFVSIFGFPRAAEYLMDMDIDINVKNEDGCTALAFASRHGYEDIVSLLLSHGANVNALDSRGWTSLMEASRNGHSDIVKILLDNGADLAHQGNKGSDALILAS